MADYDRFNLRFTEKDAPLRESLEDAARKNNRSLHQEIMVRLADSFARPDLELRVAALEQAVFKKGK